MMIPGEDSVPVLLTLAVKYLSDCPAALQQLLQSFIQCKHHNLLMHLLLSLMQIHWISSHRAYQMWVQMLVLAIWIFFETVNSFKHCELWCKQTLKFSSLCFKS